MGFVPEAIWRMMRDPRLYRLDLDEAEHGQGKARPHVGLRCGPARLGLVFKSHKGKRVGAEPKANGKGMRFDIGSALDIEYVEQLAFPDGALWRPEFGGVQTTLLLDKKPAEAEFEFELELPPGAGLWHQPALTPEEKALGASRPDWAVGSYALVGPRGEKLGHFPRPWARAANGDWQWGELAIVGNTLVKRFDPTWFLGLDFGAGVKADASMGYTGIGASSGTGLSLANYAWVSGPYAAVGTATSVSMYGWKNPATSVTLGIYQHGVAASTFDLVADTAGGNCPTSAAWFTQNLDASATLSEGRVYWPGYGEGENWTAYYDVSIPYDIYYKAWTYVAGSLPSTLSSLAVATDGYRMSLYVTYTPAAAGGGLLVHPGMAGGMRG